MDEKEIIDLYWARSELAIVETDKKYGPFCHRIAFNILFDREDSEECVNDTYFSTWNAIPPKRPEKFSAFLGKLTRNLAITRCRKKNAQKRGRGELPLALEELGSCVPDKKTTEEIYDSKLLVSALNRFLADLPGETRRIFLQRYWALSSVKEIASLYDISESKVKMSLLRTRTKLRSFLEQEGIMV